MRTKRLGLIFCALSAPLLAQTPPAKSPSKTLTDCRAEVERLKTENYELQKKVNDLLSQQLDQAKKTTGKEAEALQALQALDSVSDSANFSEYQRYYLDAKVKVDSLTDGPTKVQLKSAADAYGDVLELWRGKIGRHLAYYGSDLAAWEAKYPGMTQSLPSQYHPPIKGVMPASTTYDVSDLMGYIEKIAKARLAEASGTKGRSAPSQ